MYARFALFSFLFLVLSCTGNSALVGKWQLAESVIEQAIAIFEDEQKEFARMRMGNTKSKHR